MATKLLTREMLEDYGIISITPDTNNPGQWVIVKSCRIFNTKKYETRTMVQSKVSCKHKYAPTKTYPSLNFSYKSKNIAITINRLVYAWFYGEVPAGYDVDHIDNNPFNNALDNLQLLTRQDNIKKRYTDNNSKSFNQWKYINNKGE